MKGIIETSVYLVIFALVCFFSIDFIRINQRVSDSERGYEAYIWRRKQGR